MAAPQRKPNDKDKFRREWLANLALQASNNQLNQNASNMFKQTGASSLVKDIITPTERSAKAEGDKHLARDFLSGNNFMNSFTAGEAVTNLLRPDDLRFLLEYQDFIAKDFKPRQVPAEVFVNYLRRLRDKTKKTQGVEYGLQETSGFKLLSGLSLDGDDKIAYYRALLREAPFEPAQRAEADALIDRWERLMPTDNERAILAEAPPEYEVGIMEDYEVILGSLPEASVLEYAVETGDMDAVREVMTPPAEAVAAKQDINASLDEIGRLAFAWAQNPDNPASAAVGAEEKGLQFGSKEQRSGENIGDLFGNEEIQPSSTGPAPYGDISRKKPIPPIRLGKVLPRDLPPSTNQPLNLENLPSNFGATPEQLTSVEGFPVPNPYAPAKQNAPVAKPVVEKNPALDKQRQFPLKEPMDFRLMDKDAKLNYLRNNLRIGKFFNSISGTKYTAESLAALSDDEIATWYSKGFNAYQDQIDEGRGLVKGTGLGKKKKSAVERSTGYVKPQPYTQLGSYLINRNKLKDGVLMVKYPSGQRIAKLPSQAITKELVAILNVLIEGKQPTIRQFQVLSEPEKEKLHQIVRTTGLGVDVPNPREEDMDKELNHFEILKGEIIAGNDNPKLIKEFKAMLIKFGREGRIPRREVNSILEEMLHMGH